MERLTSGERRKAIAAAALEIVDEEGIGRLTLRNVAKRVGISEAAIYRHFTDKEAVVAELTALAFYPAPSGDKLRALSPDEALERVMLGQLERFAISPQLTAVAFQEDLFRNYPAVAERFIEHRETREGLVSQIIRDGQEQGKFRSSIDPDVFAVIYMGSLRMTVLKWRCEGYTSDLVAQGCRVLSELLKLLEESV